MLRKQSKYCSCPASVKWSFIRTLTGSSVYGSVAALRLQEQGLVCVRKLHGPQSSKHLPRDPLQKCLLWSNLCYQDHWHKKIFYYGPSRKEQSSRLLLTVDSQLLAALYWSQRKEGSSNEVLHLKRTVCLQRLYYRNGSGRRRQEYLKTHLSEKWQKHDIKGPLRSKWVLLGRYNSFKCLIWLTSPGR